MKILKIKCADAHIPYFNGDKGKYTGKVDPAKSDKFYPLYEIEMLEGHMKGQKKWVRVGPDGIDPTVARNQAQWKKEQEAFAKLHNKKA